MGSRAQDAVVDAIATRGGVRFDEYVELALYDPDHGFFATGGQAGRVGADFITSVEVGPLFGAVVALRLDALWDELGRPSPFTVLECGAGRGALAIAVRAAGCRCAADLHWVMVERSASLRARQTEHLPIDGGERPRFSQAANLPTEPVVGAVVANELLDNVPFRLVEHRRGTWREVWVVAGPPEVDRITGPPVLIEELRAVPDDIAIELHRLAPMAADGARVPWQVGASRWVGSAIASMSAGLVLAVDYADETASLAGRPTADWLRTYRSHSRGDAVLEAPGTQDITVEVAVDQLPTASRRSDQATWLREWGIDALVADARRRWAERAGVGDLAAIRARSTVGEAEALCDPAGLGAFTVMEWDVHA